MDLLSLPVPDTFGYIAAFLIGALWMGLVWALVRLMQRSSDNLPTTVQQMREQQNLQNLHPPQQWRGNKHMDRFGEYSQDMSQKWPEDAA